MVNQDTTQISGLNLPQTNDFGRPLLLFFTDHFGFGYGVSSAVRSSAEIAVWSTTINKSVGSFELIGSLSGRGRLPSSPERVCRSGLTYPYSMSVIILFAFLSCSFTSSTPYAEHLALGYLAMVLRCRLP